LFDLWRDFIGSSWIDSCNISTNDSLLPCVLSYASDDDIEEWAYYYQQTTKYPEFVNADSCVADTYAQGFEDSDDDLNHDSDFAAALILPLFFGLI